MFAIIYCDKSTVPVIDVRNAVNFRTTLFNLRSLSDKIVAFKFVSKLHLQLPRFSAVQFIILTFLLCNSKVEICLVPSTMLVQNCLCCTKRPLVGIKTYLYHLFGYVYEHCKKPNSFRRYKKERTK